MSRGPRNIRNALTLLFAAGLGIAGCGTPGAPQPPSLNLPDRVLDLSAVRTGNHVSLTWTMPKRNTDKLNLKGNVPVRVCRREAVGDCASAGDLDLAPAAGGSFSEMLPPKLAAGRPRALSYFVELKNLNGRSAGFSNQATLLAGQSPSSISGLAAEVRKTGVILRWAPDKTDAAIRLRRKLLTPSATKPQKGLLGLPSEPTEKSLLVEGGDASKGLALDRSVAFGQSYEYRAQRISHAQVDGHTLELGGEISAPIHIDVQDVFPPDNPTGLAAVATAPDTASGINASIDLSWQPVTDTDLAGYEVYRREEQSPWVRISGDQPLAAPAYRDMQVHSGHTYIYTVTAVDVGGHVSGRSEEAREAVPAP